MLSPETKYSKENNRCVRKRIDKYESKMSSRKGSGENGRSRTAVTHHVYERKMTIVHHQNNAADSQDQVSYKDLFDSDDDRHKKRFKNIDVNESKFFTDREFIKEIRSHEFRR